MPNIEYVTSESRGIHYISLAPIRPKTPGISLTRVDCILIAMVISTYLGLYICLR